MSSASSSSSSSMLEALDEDALVEVALAAKSARVLGRLATTSKQLCDLARSRVPVELCVASEQEVAVVLGLLASGRPLFSSCGELMVAGPARSTDNCRLAAQLLSAGQWTALQQLELWTRPDSIHNQQQQQSGQACSLGICGVLSLPAVQHLRALDLSSLPLGACSVQGIGQLVQLTRMSLDAHVDGGGATEGAVAAALAAAGAVPVDWTPLSRLTNLRELVLCNPPVVQPAAGPEGLFSLPSSLTRLVLEHSVRPEPPIGCWVTHLPGCRQLQEVEVMYGRQQHASAHPGALLRLLALHNRHLRTFKVINTFGLNEATWSAVVEGLPDAVGFVGEWRPAADLAGLRCLECLSVGQPPLVIRSAADWQHLAQVPAFTQLSHARIYSVPDLLPGASLSLLELEGWDVDLGGYDLGRMLLACPRLQRAEVSITALAPPELPPPGRPSLPTHVSLKAVGIRGCLWWGRDAAAAAAHFAGLAPVLGQVSELQLWGWHGGRSVQAGAAIAQLPDLSPCTALSSLLLDVVEQGPGAGLEQEDFLLMLAHSTQLQRLQVSRAPGLNARVVLVLQHMLPRLQSVLLRGCGQVLPLAERNQQQQQAAHPWWQQQQQQQAADEEERQQAAELLAKVRQLLRPGLELEVRGVDGY